MVNDFKIGVVVVAYRSGAYLEGCLSSLERQTRPPDRIVVVDNHSADGSVAAVVASRPSVEAVDAGGNVGFARANNMAVASLEGMTHVALVNPDVVAEPEWLEKMVVAMREHPDAGSFASLMTQADAPEIVDGAGDSYHLSGLAWRTDYGRGVGELAFEEREIFAPCAAAALYRRDAFLAVGGFDERYFCYFEDVDLGFRLRSAGYSSWLIPSARVAHVGSAITGTESEFTIYHGHRNLVWTWAKNMPLPLLLRSLPEHLLMNLIALVWYALRGKGGAVFRAKRDALAGLFGANGIWGERKRIPEEAAARIAPYLIRSPLAPYLRRRRPGFGKSKRSSVS